MYNLAVVMNLAVGDKNVKARPQKTPQEKRSCATSTNASQTWFVATGNNCGSYWNFGCFEYVGGVFILRPAIK